MTYTEKERKDRVHEAVLNVACAELKTVLGDRPFASVGEFNLKMYIHVLRGELRDMEAAYYLVHGHSCDMDETDGVNC